VTRLAVWSGPRSISTALMRAWENRGDTLVLDEPLYAHYLAATGLDHPGRDEVIATGPTDWPAAVARLLEPMPDGVAVVYQKHMAHHLLPDLDHDWVAQLTNVLLIRDPREVVASYIRARPDVTVEDVGFPQQVQLYDELVAAGAAPRVIESSDLLGAPERFLRSWCDDIGVAFTDRMLSWPPGPRDSDGVWAEHWYESVWQSTGFAPQRERQVDLAGAAAKVAEACMPLYRALWDVRWQP
jgi:hypothetical protein